MYKTIDLFAGAGGLSLGFKQTNKFNIIAAAEINKNAQETYKLNIPNDNESFEMIENVISCNFKELNERLGGIEVVIGGPPCQGFSNANRQKNTLISMNNALIKEYFRAIKEIKPKVFVMENVSMLESNTHRFYDSMIDHNEIENLKESGCAIATRNDNIFISKNNIKGFDMSFIANSIDLVNELILPKELNDLVRILNKNKSNKKRLANFLFKQTKVLIRLIDQYSQENNNCNEYKEKISLMLFNIKDHIVNDVPVEQCIELTQLVELQKNLYSIKEIYNNKLIGKFVLDEGNNVVFSTKSYSVIDYVNAILGDQYEQKGATLNAKWFGVPQERKRHIIIGVRREGEEIVDIIFPNGSLEEKCVTVEEAIMDLSEYEVGYEKETEDVPYNNQATSEYSLEMRSGSDFVKNHITTKTTERALERFKAIEQGKNFHSLSKDLITTYSNPERTQNTIYLRLNLKEPCGTVVNVRKSMWIHPTLDRAISVREAARLQSFPDSFKFIGTKDSQYQQVGNAVPPKLAKGVAEIVLSILEK